MPSHYPTLIGQLVLDIRSVVGNAIPVVFGAPMREIREPHAVVRTRLRRSMDARDGGGPRRVVEQYTFSVRVYLDKPEPPNEYGNEPYLMEQAEFLVDILAPNSHDSMPLPAGRYAGVGNPRYVTSVEPIDAEDADARIAYEVTFETYCTVNQ